MMRQPRDDGAGIDWTAEVERLRTYKVPSPLELLWFPLGALALGGLLVAAVYFEWIPL